MITYKDFYILWICLYWYFNDAVEGMWKEVVMAWFKVLSDIFLEGLRKSRKPVMIVGFMVKIQTGHLLNTSQKCYCFRQLAWATVNPQFDNSEPDDWGSAVFQTEHRITYITVFGSTNTEYIWNSQEIWAN
jgi:hypothetical protein